MTGPSKEIPTLASPPAITAVIPAYNAAEFLPATIQSVVDQSFADWELLVIDDGSTDNTANVVRQFCTQDARIKLILQENGGVSSARNRGVQEAAADLVAFLDADDRWLPNKLSVHVGHMTRHPESGVSFGRVELIETDGGTTGKLTNNISQQLRPEDLFYNNPTVTTSNMVIRKAVFLGMGGFDQTMQYNEDVDLLLRIALQDKVSIDAIDQVLVQYRLHTSGLSSTLLKMEDGWITLIDKAAKSAPQLVAKHYSAAYGAQLQYLARQTLRLNMPAAMGVSFMNRSLKRSWTRLYKNPKPLALAMLVYFKWATFNTFKVNI